MRFPRTLRTCLLLALVTGLTSGCAKRAPDITAADLPLIRADLERSPENLELRTRLGVALNKAGNYAESSEVLSTAIEDGVSTGVAYLYLGLSREGLDDWTGAREAYARYLDLGRSDPLKDELRQRLSLMVRRALEAEAGRALANEADVAQQPPAPRSLAVLPMAWLEGPDDLSPLRLAVPDMMTTDLAIVGSLTLLERTQIVALIQEMDLQESGLTEPGSGARAGRVLQAEHVVQGALTAGGEGIRLDGDVLATQSASSIDDLQQEDQLEAIFDIEKAAVFEVLDALGVEVTAQERERIGANRTASLQAFLAYGRGLEALDRGDYEAAEQFFAQAVTLDPQFQPAQDRLDEATGLDTSSDRPVEQVAERGSEEIAQEAGDGGGVSGTSDGQTARPLVTTVTVTTTVEHVAEGIDPTPTTGTIDRAAPTQPPPGEQPPEQRVQQDTQTRRTPVPESGGGEQPTGPARARIRITIPRPPGAGGGA